MKLISTLIISIFIFTNAIAQTYDWTVAAGGTSEDRAFGIATDTSGNIFTTGQFRGTATFGTISVTAAGVEDMFVSKQDAAGNFLWVFAGGGSGPDFGYDIVTDQSGNCYVTGTYHDQANFGGVNLNSTGIGDYEIFTLKLNASGTLQWVKSAGGSGYDVGRGIAISGAQLFVGGNIEGSVSFGNVNANGFGLYDIFVASYNLNGGINWVSVAGGTGYDIANGVCADAAGNAYLTGYFQNTATFGSSTLTNTGNFLTDIFVTKVNASGTFQWAQRGGNPNDDDIGRAIDCDASGNVYAAGEYRGTATFGTVTVTNAGIADIFVAKYSTNGDLQYVSTEGGAGGDYGYGIAATSSKIYITGLFNGIVQFGTTTLSSAGSNDIYLAELDAATGAYNWSLRAGGTGDDAGRAVAFNSDGFVAYGGDFEHSPSTFGPFSLNTHGGHDIFIAKVEVTSCATATVSISAAGATTFCQGGSVTLTSTSTNAISFQWKKNGLTISGATNAGFTASVTGSFTLTVTDNCGNSITSNAINVTVKKLPTAVISPSGIVNICSGDTVLLSANTAPALTFKWTKNNVTIPGETSSTLKVTTAGVYRVVTTNSNTGCSKTSQPTKVKVTCKLSVTEEVVNIYPNPSANSFRLQGITEPVNVEIADLSGKIIEHAEISGDVSFGNDLPAGVFLVRIYFPDETMQVVKILKQ